MAAALLRKILNTPYWTFYAALSILFLTLGVWAGVVTAGWIPAGVNLWLDKPEGTPQAAALPANGQRNLLVVGVDGLEREAPILESLWLVLYFPGRSPVTLMPLYPRPEKPENLQGEMLLEAFSLTRSGDPSPAFFERLRREQVWWNGYVLLDGAAVAVLLDQLGGIDLDGQHLDGTQAIAGLPRAQEDRSGALEGQVRLLRSACAQAGRRLTTWPEVASLAGGLVNHLHTDMDLSGLVQGWLQAAGPAPAFECEFPLIDASRSKGWTKKPFTR